MNPFGEPPKKKTLIEKLNAQIEATKKNIETCKANVEYYKNENQFDNAHTCSISLESHKYLLEILEYILND